jgi:hypothetical protein
MERSKCCQAPLIEEKLSSCVDTELHPTLDVQVVVEVCSNCGSIVFAHEPHMTEHEPVREFVLR